MDERALLDATAVYIKIQGEWGNVTGLLIRDWLNQEHDYWCIQNRISRCYRCYAEKSVAKVRKIIEAYEAKRQDETIPQQEDNGTFQGS